MGAASSKTLRADGTSDAVVWFATASNNKVKGDKGVCNDGAVVVEREPPTTPTSDRPLCLSPARVICEALRVVSAPKGFKTVGFSFTVRVDDRGCTPLHLAIGKGMASAQIVAMLVRACPDSVDVTDRSAGTDPPGHGGGNATSIFPADGLPRHPS